MTHLREVPDDDDGPDADLRRLAAYYRILLAGDARIAAVYGELQASRVGKGAWDEANRMVSEDLDLIRGEMEDML